MISTIIYFLRRLHTVFISKIFFATRSLYGQDTSCPFFAHIISYMLIQKHFFIIFIVRTRHALSLLMRFVLQTIFISLFVYNALLYGQGTPCPYFTHIISYMLIQKHFFIVFIVRTRHVLSLLRHNYYPNHFLNDNIMDCPCKDNVSCKVSLLSNNCNGSSLTCPFCTL